VEDLQAQLAATVEGISGGTKEAGDSASRKAQGYSNAIFAEVSAWIDTLGKAEAVIAEKAWKILKGEEIAGNRQGGSSTTTHVEDQKLRFWFLNLQGIPDA